MRLIVKPLTAYIPMSGKIPPCRDGWAFYDNVLTHIREDKKGYEYGKKS